MPNEKLENLVKIRQLKAEPASKEEIAGLEGSGIARLEDSKNADLNKESRFDLAYNAAHALSLAALRAAGYRSENRYVVFQCTQHTLNIELEHWRVLDQAHGKRNLAEYEGDIDVDDQLLEALIRVVELIAGKLREVDDIQGALSAGVLRIGAVTSPTWGYNTATGVPIIYGKL